jgi:hypothetical protein
MRWCRGSDSIIARSSSRHGEANAAWPSELGERKDAVLFHLNWLASSRLLGSRIRYPRAPSRSFLSKIDAQVIDVRDGMSWVGELRAYGMERSLHGATVLIR